MDALQDELAVLETPSPRLELQATDSAMSAFSTSSASTAGSATTPCSAISLEDAAVAAPEPSPSPAHCHELGSKGATGSAGRSVAASQHSAAASTFSFDSGSSVRHDDNPTPHGRPT